MINKNHIILKEDIQITGLNNNFNTQINLVSSKNGVSIFEVAINAKKAEKPEPLTLLWKIPAHNVKGVWKPTTDFAKRMQADWEMDHMESRISIDAPVISLFGHDDSNRHTFACSDAINKLELNSRIREEDDCFYCHITLFSESVSDLTSFNFQIRIDSGEKHFSQALKDISAWWETLDNLKPTSVPEIAQMPLYSTWYNFHQNLEENTLLDECKLAYSLGYKSIIIDDGWQTNDGNRGYDYTGDWNPDRLSKTKEFVDDVHAIGMKIGFWYSVPFCGKHSEAYKRFKGKFLTEDHRWAPVFDPRYPEIRSYLINIYKSALIDWNLDGFKLDFIDDFRWYPETPEKNEEMDFYSINEAVDRLLTDVMETLRAINPDVFIEFRQKYTGPAMRKYGNMFRAFDCPADSAMNRIRIADIKMLAGNTAVHSDMITWDVKESVEVAALQMVNTLFGVPQISVVLKEIPDNHLKMVKFYTQFWNEKRDLIINGNFVPSKPLANYPINQVSQNNETMIGVFDDNIMELQSSFSAINIINGKLTDYVVIKSFEDFGNFNCQIFDCMGNITNQQTLTLEQGLSELKVPACGLIKLTKQN